MFFIKTFRPTVTLSDTKVCNPQMKAPSLIFLGAFSLCLSGNALADISSKEEVDSEETKNVITVVSQWRQNPLTKTPLSLVTFSEQDVKERNATHLDDLLRATANVSFSAGSNRSRFVQIRGIGERSQYQNPVNPSVGFYLDGIDVSGLFGAATIYDIAQLEVLRGPQGTRFGASALAGAIYLATEEADSQNQHVDFSIAEQNTFTMGMAMGGATGEHSALRVAVQKHSSDGYIKNQYLNRDNTNGRDELTSRIKWKWNLSDNATLRWAHHFIDVNNGYDAFSLDNDRFTRSDEPGFDKQKTHATSAIIDIANANIDWQILLAASDHETDYAYDEDWTFVGFHPWEYSSFDRYYREKSAVNLDVRAVSSQPSQWLGLNTDWTVGLYIKDDNENLLRQYTYLASDFASEFNTQTVALYGETTWHLADETRLITGLRVENRAADYLDTDNFSQTTDETMVGGRISLDHDLTDTQLVYAMLARCFKSGGVNPNNELTLDKRIFNSETNWSLELGYKQQLLNSRGYWQLSVFSIERNNQQTNQWQIDTSSNPPEFTGYVGNVDNGNHSGLELEWQIPMGDTFEFTGSVGYLATKLDLIDRGEDGQIANREAAQAPNFTYHFATRWFANENWAFMLIAEGKDKEYFSESHDEQSKAVSLVHANVSYNIEDWSIRFWIKNLTNQDYYIKGFGGFGNDPRDGYTAKPYYQYGNPKQTGVSFSYSF